MEWLGPRRKMQGFISWGFHHQFHQPKWNFNQQYLGNVFFSVISVILAIKPSSKSSDIAILDNDALKIIYKLQWLQLALWLFNIAMENGPSGDDSEMKESMHSSHGIARVIDPKWLQVLYS